MKQILRKGLWTLLAVMLFWACSSESYPGLSYEDVDVVMNNETPDPNAGLPINVYVNEQSVVTLSSNNAFSSESDMTRGVGAFLTWEEIRKDSTNKRKLNEYSEEENIKLKLKHDTTTFYILAFRDKEAKAAPDDYSQRLLNPTDLHTWYQVDKENPPSSNVYQDALRLDCLVDGKDYYKGMRANINADQFLKMDRPETSPLYWGEYQEVSYNFFAYSVGDINCNPNMYLKPDVENKDDVENIYWGKPHRDADKFWYENFAIDGSQDLMAGYAPQITKDMFEEGGRYATQRKQLTDNELHRILTDEKYTSFAAHRNVEPVIDLKHLLTRLRFTMVAGDSTASYTTIDSVYVTSPYHGDFVVAVNSSKPEDLAKIGFKPRMDEVTNLYLHDESVTDEDGHLLPTGIMKVDNTDKANVEKRTVLWKDEYWDPDDLKKDPKVYTRIPLNQREHKRIGDDLLIPEQEQITLVIKSTYDPARNPNPEKGKGDRKREFRSRYIIKAASQANSPTDPKYYDAEQGKCLFKRGYIYDVTMVVYGLQKIMIWANVEEWEDGGEVIIDPDDTDDHEYTD